MMKDRVNARSALWPLPTHHICFVTLHFEATVKGPKFVTPTSQSFVVTVVSPVSVYM
jgi:hypothetical protein